MKKIISLFLIVSIFPLFYPTPSVSTNNTEINVYKNYLIDIGTPTILVENLTDSALKQIYSCIYDKNVAYKSHQTQLLSSSTDDAHTYGAISEDDMRLSFISYAVGDYVSENIQKVDYLYCFVTYDWLHLPLVRWNDPITVNWDSDLFTMSDFYAVDEYSLVNSNEFITFHEMQNPTELSQGGLGYFADLARIDISNSDVNILIDSLTGTASFKLLSRTIMYHGGETTTVTSINTNYVHDKRPIRLADISFAIKDFQVSINFSGLQDSVAIASNFRYGGAIYDQ